MKTKISAFVDGELESSEFSGVIEVIEQDEAARGAWRVYHLISDALRDTALRDAGFSARVAQALAAEPTVLAPGRLPAERTRWFALSAAASVAAVALVGWLAFAPTPDQRPEGLPGVPLASVPQPAATVQQAASSHAAAPAAQQLVAVQREPVAPAAVPVSAQMASDYLFAHQEFSPGMSLQGMAPYVRTVSTVSPGAHR
jgi:sigma-E factor negative regulatory protein RseA